MTKLTKFKKQLIEIAISRGSVGCIDDEFSKYCDLLIPFEQSILSFEKEYKINILKICDLFYQELLKAEKPKEQIVNEVKFYLKAIKLRKEKYNFGIEFDDIVGKGKWN